MRARWWLPVLLPALLLARAGGAPAGADAGVPPSPAARLDRLVAAALVELDRLEEEGVPAAEVRLPAIAGPSIALDPGPVDVRRVRLSRLLARMAALLAAAREREPGDRPTRRLLAAAVRAVARARGHLAASGAAPPDPALLRAALLRVDAASAALWSLQPQPPLPRRGRPLGRPEKEVE